MHLSSLVPEAPSRVDQWDTRYWASAGVKISITTDFHLHHLHFHSLYHRLVSPVKLVFSTATKWEESYAYKISQSSVLIQKVSATSTLCISEFWSLSLFNFPITHHILLIPIDFLCCPSSTNTTDSFYHIISTPFCPLNFFFSPHLKNRLFWSGLRGFAFQNHREADSTDVVVNFNDCLHVSSWRH